MKIWPKESTVIATKLKMCYLSKKSLKISKGQSESVYIEEEQTTQCPKEKVQKEKQRSTKYTHKTKDRVTRTPLKSGSELRCSGRVSNSCSTSGTRRVILVTNPVISHEWGAQLWNNMKGLIIIFEHIFCNLVRNIV